MASVTYTIEYLVNPENGEIAFWGLNQNQDWIKQLSEEQANWLMLEPEFEADCKVVDNGIGCYEFWGCKGVDTRLETEVVSEISWNNKAFADDQNKIIGKYLDLNASAVEESLIEKFENEAGDY